MAKITEAFMRDLQTAQRRGEISYSRMVEMLNEKAAEKAWEAAMVQCELCANKWAAVMPEGTTTLECPNCGYNGEVTFLRTDI